MAFSFAVAALIEGRVDAAWGRWVRPWTLAAWVFLTIGIGLGSSAPIANVTNSTCTERPSTPEHVLSTPLS